ncbi:MAG TPA: hypothetical protein VLE53_19975 [Gemmatimonadaceae bacterium]|nr:hypothetical protein [Gemmatimonadaceae bacterium]
MARRLRAAGAILILASCTGAGTAGEDLRVALDTARTGAGAVVLLTGLSSAERATLRGVGAERAARLLRVNVAGRDSTPVAGTWRVSDSAFEFRPAFALDRGRRYDVRVDPSQLSPPRGGPAFVSAVMLPAGDTTPATRVVQVFPSSDSVPANLLRMYVQFSAPMSREGALDHVRLLDEDGREVPAAFLPLEADFWNEDRTRYTLFLDPGRVKRGILPNEQMGRAILAGRRYALVIDARWRDAQGRPLVAPHRHAMIGAPPDEKPVALADWRLSAPRAGSRDTLAVTFGAPLDQGLLRRAMGVEDARGHALRGEIAIAPGERAWRFVPGEPWRAGQHRLVVLAILEDPSGNRIGRAFEVDRFERVDSIARPDRHTLPFTVR